MPRFEFKVIPAPTKGKSAKGVKSRPEKFAHALSLIMNEMGAEGWDYVRADTLPCEERHGLTSKVTTYHNVLVFRREVAEEIATDEATANAETALAESDDEPDRADLAEAHAELLTRGEPLTADAPDLGSAPALNGATRDGAQAG
ncbi:MAG: DUF4177 domain-containing protein [Brevirhabdus sp.]